MYNKKNKFHLIANEGWMNDPNGFSYFDGQYHVFYQYHSWCENVCYMDWFETISSDLVDFKDVGVALTPKKLYEGTENKNGGCWSGSYYKYDGRNHLLYTGCKDNTQVTCVAVQDDNGVYHQYEANPVNSPNLEITQADSFRDPFYFSYKGQNYYIIGTMTYEKKARVHLYKQKNEFEFEYVGIFYSDDNIYMFECVSVAFFGEKVVLIYSPMGGPRGKYKHQNNNANVYHIGYINENLEFVKETEMQDLDFGYDYYAAQVLEHNGKHYIIAWVCLWGKTIENIPSFKLGRVGAMTLVREFDLVGNKLTFKPVDALDKYFSLSESKKIEDTYCFSKKLLYKLELLDINSDSDLALKLLDDGEHYFSLNYDSKEKELSIDVHNSEYKNQNIYYPNKRYYKFIDSEISSLTIYVDEDIIEVYINQNEAVMTSHYFYSSTNIKNIIFTKSAVFLKIYDFLNNV